MASFLPFMEPEDCDNIQIVVLTGIYGWVLFTAAGMIGKYFVSIISYSMIDSHLIQIQ